MSESSSDSILRLPHAHSADDVLAALASDARLGLSTAEVRARLERDGPNELAADAPIPIWKRFLAQFREPLVIVLLIATAISVALWMMERDASLPYEAIAIFAIVLLNAVMGTVQESRAESAVAALRQMAAAQASVVRDGDHARVPAAELVRGDIILLEEGDTIPADARLIHTTALQTAEAALTGESVPVEKGAGAVAEDATLGDRAGMVFSGTAVTYGRGRAVVTATGMQTEMGRIAGMLKETPEARTPLQNELDQVARRLGVIVVVIAVVMIITLMLVSHVRGWVAFFDVLIVGVALAVAAVPEGLPTIVTVVLALGVQRMAKRRAIVRHLAAVETLGSATVIASDKTGTLTKNEMTVRMVVTASGCVTLEGAGYEPRGAVQTEGGEAPEGPLADELRRALTVAERANNAVLHEREGRWLVQGDPTEGALIAAARKAGLTGEGLDARFSRVAEVPFSSERKLMSTVHTDAESSERLLVFTKGAPDVLVTRCSHEAIGVSRRELDDEGRASILRANEELAGRGMRTLGIAWRELPPDAFDSEDADEQVEQDLVFLGLIGMIDRPRPEAMHAVAHARSAGIRPVMVTGDHPKTAAAIAAELGIASDKRVVTGIELERMDDRQLAAVALETSVYARVNPEHKLRLVKALQSGGHTVAMTGDGVNDAPALKAADIGVAMGITGTDVSRRAADVVLTDDNFATIVAAVEEGRAVFGNIRKFLRYLLSSNIGEVMTMFFGVIFARVIGLEGQGDGMVLPLLATQILWINLVTDGAPALALGLDPADPDVMQRKPRPPGERVITRRMWGGIVFVGAIMAAGTLLILDASLPGGLVEGTGSMRQAQTMAFTTLVMYQLFNVLNARSDDQSAFHGGFRNRWLAASVVLSLALQAAVIYTPFLSRAFSTTSLTIGDWVRCAAMASTVLWLREASKLLTRRLRPALERAHRSERAGLL